MPARIGKCTAIALLVSSMGVGLILFDRALSKKAAEPIRVSTSAVVELPKEALQPIPQSLELDPRKVAFGKRLFRDKRLSQNGEMSCASCHQMDHGGADNEPFSKGLRGHLTEVNVPTIWNSYFSVAQFWDGRVTTLEDQVDYPLTNPSEMGSNWPEVIARLQVDATYISAASHIYGTGVTPAVVRDAIATYERSLISHNSRFDEFLRGRIDALTLEERKGYRLFKEYGCVSCHQGAAVGGNMFQRLGIFGDYFGDRGGPIAKADLGRFNVTQDPQDRHVFKVPSLRNVTETAPYFHDGSAATLENAIALMARYQLGRKISGSDIQLISTFLATLTDHTTGSAP